MTGEDQPTPGIFCCQTTFLVLLHSVGRLPFSTCPCPVGPRNSGQESAAKASAATQNKTAKAKYLSKALVALWAKADAHTPKGDVGPIDFDPVTNSQEPDVKSFKVDAEKTEADKATIAVTISGHRDDRKPADQVVRYDFVREANSWRIDDIKGSSDGEAWSIRKMLTDSLKS